MQLQQIDLYSIIGRLYVDAVVNRSNISELEKELGKELEEANRMIENLKSEKRGRKEKDA